MQNLTRSTHDTTALYNLPYIRVTSWQDFEKCPYTWAMKYLVDGPMQVQSKFARIGTAVHTMCEEHINEVFCNRHKDQAEFDQAMSIVPVEELDNVVTYLNLFTDMDVKHLATEIRLSHDFHPGAPKISGQMDFVFEDAEGCLVIMDHKTHRHFEPASYWENRLQQLCYAWMARKQWPEYKRVKFRIGYPNLGTYVEWETYAEDDVHLLKRLHSLWNDMVQYNATNQWPQRVNEECKWCPMRTTCKANIDAVQNFQTAMLRTVGSKTTAEKLLYVKNVIKSAEAIEEDLIAKLAEEIQEAGGELKTSEGYWHMSSSNRRSAQFTQTWDTMFLYANQVPGVGQWLRENAEELFTVKVGGLEKFAKQFNVDIAPLTTTTTSAPSPSFKAEKPITRALRQQAKENIAK